MFALNYRKGFTLTELLVVMIIIAILVAIAVPQFVGYSKNANLTALRSDLDLLRKVKNIYEYDKNSLPPTKGSPITISRDTNPTLYDEITKMGLPADGWYELDLTKIKSQDNMIKRIHYGNGKTPDDRFIINQNGNAICYEKGVEGKDGKIYHCVDNENPKWVYVGQNEQYKTLQEAIAHKEKRIIVRNGTYFISSPLLLDYSVYIKGEDKNKTIIQINGKIDGFILKADSTTLENITINGNDAACPLVQVSCNNVMVRDCIIYGPSDWFTVYFAGRYHEQGEDTIRGYENDELDEGNILENNVIYAPWDGDAVSFALQKNGKVKNNKIIGGRLAFYMCKNSIVEGNYLQNSSSQGIYISIPAENNIIQDNIIENSRYSSIKVAVTLEHPVPENYRAKNILITNNTIKNSKYMGIEIDKLSNSKITNNTIDNTDGIGIYLLRSNNLIVETNKINNIGCYIYNNNDLYGFSHSLISGIMLDYDTQNCTITRNNIYNQSNGGKYGILVIGDSTVVDNIISYNKLNGFFAEMPIRVNELEKEVIGNEY